MNREQFLHALRTRLDYLPAPEVEKSVAFYAECIDDRVEDGMAEEEAVAALGGLNEIVREIEMSLPLSTIVKRRVETGRERRGHSALFIALAVAGSPVWLPLGITAAVLALTMYVVIWAVVISLFAALLALFASALALVVYGLVKSVALGLPATLMVLGGAAMCAGLALLLWHPVRLLAAAAVRLAARFGCRLKGLLLGRKGE